MIVILRIDPKFPQSVFVSTSKGNRTVGNGKIERIHRLSAGGPCSLACHAPGRAETMISLGMMISPPHLTIFLERIQPQNIDTKHIANFQELGSGTAPK